MRCVVLFLLMLCVFPLGAEEIGQLIYERKAGRLELSLTGGVGYGGASGAGMRTSDLETYMWGSGSSLSSSGAELLEGLNLKLGVGANYFLGSHFSLFGSIGMAKRSLEATWWTGNPSDSEIKYKVDISYLEICFGPRVYFGSFYFGVDGFIGLPVSNSTELSATRGGTEFFEKDSLTSDMLNMVYGVNFRLGWVTRFTAQFSMDLALNVQKDLNYLFQKNWNKPVYQAEDGATIAIMLSFNWAIN